MTLVEIDINNEPQCLQDLRQSQKNTYENLQGDCRIQVQQQLRLAQMNLCAYCQKSIEYVITIEHYLPQSTNSALQLEFSNFLGICSGKDYLPVEKGKKPKKFTSHCGDNRKNTALTVDPRNQADIDTLSFDEKDRIVSSNAGINNDLNNTLNLNFEGLCQKRKKKYDDLLTLLLTQGLQMSLDKEAIYRRALAMVEEKKPEYYGYLKFRLTQLLSSI